MAAPSPVAVPHQQRRNGDVAEHVNARDRDARRRIIVAPPGTNGGRVPVMRPGSRFGGLNGTGQLEWSRAPGATCSTPLWASPPHAQRTIRGRRRQPVRPLSGGLHGPVCPLRPVLARRLCPYAVHPGGPAPLGIRERRDLGRLDLASSTPEHVGVAHRDAGFRADARRSRPCGPEPVALSVPCATAMMFTLLNLGPAFAPVGVRDDVVPPDFAPRVDLPARAAPASERARCNA